MEAYICARRAAPAAGCRMPSHLPLGAVLLALLLGEESRGVAGLDVLRRSVDRAPPLPR
ncbi:hypothetical protein [Nocardioides sp. TF02-7]|uniref:hypothetical protein n=1 Tax=Nocardioides sp. TF02-7 TaxID=2917724 RepID=UPI001F0703A5|nr:hypothetical protein [Nocardioides sp. TF02-7]UMG92754.1 hypothetical protein MF408_24120 [Nocardioides sp. TF02-7]